LSNKEELAFKDLLLEAVKPETDQPLSILHLPIYRKQVQMKEPHQVSSRSIPKSKDSIYQTKRMKKMKK